MSPAILPTGAFAQPPSNDDFDNATVISSLPFSDSINTQEATRAEDDPEGSECRLGGNTVWYSFSPDEDVAIQANTFGSGNVPNPDGSRLFATLAVYTGSRGNLEQITCNDGVPDGSGSQIFFEAIAGETYFFMAASFGTNSGGGNLVFNVGVGEAPPPFDLEVSINPTLEHNPKTDEFRFTGTVTCSEPSNIRLDGELRQINSNKRIGGIPTFFVFCAGEEEPTPWSSTAIRWTVKTPFAGQPARTIVNIVASGCGTNTCDEDKESVEVLFRGPER